MKYLIVITQAVTTWIFRLVKFIVVGQQSINATPDNWSGKLVIIANHISMVDPFIITSAIPYARFVPLSPFRFFVANRFFSYWLLLPFLFSHGCFPAKKHNRYKSGVDYAAWLVEDGQIVTIFPEGKIGKIDRTNIPKRGVEVLARLPGVKLVPARVKLNRKKKFWNSYSLAIGKPFDGSNMTAEQIMDVVYSLKFR